ncbi:MAG: nitrogenase component 1 [Actinomycetota bacterium]|nr:nitrogenase component 1 [Actinomycetota bacterium]
MKKNYLVNYNLSPDSLTGIINAASGIKDTLVIINGPTGCRLSNAYFVSSQDVYKDFIADPTDLNDDFFMRQLKVPSTALDEFDFIFSSEPKLLELLKKIGSDDFYKFVAIVNSSGTSLIGDDLDKIVKKSKMNKDYITIETSGYSEDVFIGFQKTVLKILDKFCSFDSRLTVKRKSKSVNLIGFSLLQYNWFNDVQEIREILNLLGININSVICANMKLDDFKKLKDADLNLIISEEYGNMIGQYLYDSLEIPYIGMGTNRDDDIFSFSPYGFDFTDDFVDRLSSYFKVSKKNYIYKRDEIKRRSYLAINSVSGTRGTLKGLRFGIFADSYQIYPLTKFLYEYLGLYPALLGLKGIGNHNFNAIKDYIKERGLDTLILENYSQFDLRKYMEILNLDVVFGNSLERNILRSLDKEFIYINIYTPDDGKTNLTFKPLMGIDGVLTILEQLINSIKEKNYNYRY